MIDLLNTNITRVTPTWNEGNAPLFLARTSTVFTSIPYSSLGDRGIKNRLMDSILEHLPEGAYVVGGSVLSLINNDKNYKDIDIAFTKEEAFLATFNLLKSNSGNEKLENEDSEDDLWAWKGYTCQTDLSNWESTGGQNSRYILFTHPTRPAIQLLKLAWYSSPEHILDSFDLTIAQLALDKETLYMNPLSILDITRKKIVLHRMQFPASTMRRIIKYTGKGYYACAGSLGKIAEEIKNHLGDNDIDDFVYLD